MKFLRLAAIILAALMMLCSCGSPSEGLFSELPYDESSPTEEAATADTAESSLPETSSETETESAPPETSSPEETEPPETEKQPPVEKGEAYYDVESVAVYLEAYGELPPNFITKDEARELGWEGGSVEEYLDEAAIGGDWFGNYEGLLPEGPEYHECDIDTHNYRSRGSRRLIYSDDGHYYYTSDHYESFTELTVGEDYEVTWK